MIIRFKDRKLANTCNSEQSLVAQFGRDNARKIMMRLIELYSVDNLSQISSLPPPRRHALRGNRTGQYAVDVKHPFRIVFEPSNDPILINIDGHVDISRITEITILEVTDYHGE